MKRLGIIILFLFIMYGCNNIKPVGEIEVFASYLDGPDGITIDDGDRMYVGNRKTNTIVYFDSLGNIHDFVTVPCQELLIITSKDGFLYVAGTDKVFKITHDGIITQIASDFECADDIILDQNNNIYVTDSKRNIVYKITPDLKKTIFINNDYEGYIDKWFITGLAFDKDFKNLYVVRMYKGEILKYPILDNGVPGEKEIFIQNLNEPDHIIIDSQNNLYVTLFRKGDLIKINQNKTVETVCDHTMYYATGLVFGKNDFDERYIYIADYGNNNIYKIYIG